MTETETLRQDLREKLLREMCFVAEHGFVCHEYGIFFEENELPHTFRPSSSDKYKFLQIINDNLSVCGNNELKEIDPQIVAFRLMSDYYSAYGKELLSRELYDKIDRMSISERKQRCLTPRGIR